MKRQHMIDQGYLPDFESLDRLFDTVEQDLIRTFDATTDMEQIELDMAILWSAMCARPDFKPGRSNAERDMKIDAEHPDFMLKYKTAQNTLTEARNNLQLSRLRLDQAKIAIRLASILIEEEENYAS